MKVAICLRGGVSSINSTFSNSKKEYVDYVGCFNSIIKHIVNCNSHDFSFYLQSWEIPIQKELINIYNPKKYLFEDNSLYTEYISSLCKNESDFGGVSQALAIKKAINLIDENYDLIIIYRPDVILLKDINLNLYDKNKIYCNAHEDANGDFHFIMNQDNANIFKNLIDSISLGNFHKPHFWIKNYVIKYMNSNIYNDDIIPGLHQEVLRKVVDTTLSIHKVDINVFSNYGINLSELKKYKT